MTPILTQSELDALATVAVKQAAILGLTAPCDIGHVYQRERIALLAARCCEQSDGDIIEIGCYLGGTTAVLVDVARRYNRKVVCFDDFATLADYGHDNPRANFVARLPGWSDVVEFHEQDAHTDESRKLIQSRRYALAFSDDGHSTQDHIIELMTLLPVVDGLVVVDDVYFPGVKQAVTETVPLFPGWQIIEHPMLSELYCVKGKA